MILKSETICNLKAEKMNKLSNTYSLADCDTCILWILNWWRRLSTLLCKSVLSILLHFKNYWKKKKDKIKSICKFYYFSDSCSNSNDNSNKNNNAKEVIRKNWTEIFRRKKKDKERKFIVIYNNCNTYT